MYGNEGIAMKYAEEITFAFVMKLFIHWLDNCSELEPVFIFFYGAIDIIIVEDMKFKCFEPLADSFYHGVEYEMKRLGEMYMSFLISQTL